MSVLIALGITLGVILGCFGLFILGLWLVHDRVKNSHFSE